jgi:hypothetical protein
VRPDEGEVVVMLGVVGFDAKRGTVAGREVSGPRMAGGVNAGGSAVMNDEPIRGTSRSPVPTSEIGAARLDAPAGAVRARPSDASVTGAMVSADAPARATGGAPELATTIAPRATPDGPATARTE